MPRRSATATSCSCAPNRGARRCCGLPPMRRSRINHHRLRRRCSHLSQVRDRRKLPRQRGLHSLHNRNRRETRDFLSRNLPSSPHSHIQTPRLRRATVPCACRRLLAKLGKLRHLTSSNCRVVISTMQSASSRGCSNDRMLVQSVDNASWRNQPFRRLQEIDLNLRHLPSQPRRQCPRQ